LTVARGAAYDRAQVSSTRSADPSTWTRPTPPAIAAPSRVSTRAPQSVTELQRAIGNRAVGRIVKGRVLARREVMTASEIRGPQDWMTFDRNWNQKRWQDACLHNLNKVDSRQYERIPERRDFYRWFYDYTAARGYETKWPLAAWIVANGAAQIAYMDINHDWANEGLGLANVELQATMRRGNQVIFDNVLPKLKKLLDGGPLRGRAALQWDMQTLAEEQTLVQPLYDQMGSDAFDQLDYIARKTRFAGLGADWTDEDKVVKGPYHSEGIVPEFFEKNLKSINDRWLYGMKLGGRFSTIRLRAESDPEGRSWFNPRQDYRPSVGADYASGKELAKVDTLQALHFVDAWLNPHRISRTGGVAALKAGIAKLTDADKRHILADESFDGWAYSKQLAQWLTVDEVKKALPDPSLPGVAPAYMKFLMRFQAAIPSRTPVYVWF
jgi:hypothetical protein